MSALGVVNSEGTEEGFDPVGEDCLPLTGD